MGSDVAIQSAIGFEESKTSFYFSFSFLPKSKREALKTVYAFCRMTDDIVDNERDTDRKVELLSRWRSELEAGLKGTSEYRILNQLGGVADTYHIPVVHFFDLLRGVEMDLSKSRYETFEELKEYCYHVASTVGLMSLGIFGPRNERTKEYAVNLGIALQLTNIIRDVGVDARCGRIYLPLEDLRHFRYSEAELISERRSESFRKLMEFQARRAEEYFHIAGEALPREDKRAMFAAKIMERIYYRTLLKIQRMNYDVFGDKIRLPRYQQFAIAVAYWIKQRIFGL